MDGSIKLIRILTCSFLFIGYSGVINAAQKQQSINYSAGLGSPVVTTNADTMDKGAWGAGERAEYWRSIPLTDLALVEFPATESFTGGFVNYISINYGLTNNVTVGVNLPYFHSTTFRASDLEELPTAIHLGNISGVGDASFFSVWRFMDNNKYPISLALLSGLNAPTGKNSVMTRQGQLFSAGDQPGEGAWVPFGGLVLSTKLHNKLELSTNLMYTPGIRGAQYTTIGSLFDFNIAGVYEFYRSDSNTINYDLILELNNEYVAKNKTLGIHDDFSGGITAFGTFGIRANRQSGTSLYCALTLPVIERYNGVQPKTSYGVMAGIDVSLG